MKYLNRILQAVLILGLPSVAGAVIGNFDHNIDSATFSSISVTSSGTATALSIDPDDGHKILDMTVINISTSTRVHVSNSNITSQNNGFPVGGQEAAPNTVSFNLNPLRSGGSWYFLLEDGSGSATRVWYILRFMR